MMAAWPQWLTRSFQIANRPQFANDENAYHGPYNRLLHHLFGLDGPFEVVAQYLNPDTPHAIDLVSVFTVEIEKHPVLFIEIKPPSAFYVDSRREQADDQMREHFHKLRTKLTTPRLPGISAFGTRIALYEYTVATKTLTPRAIVRDPEFFTDVAPAERWNYDILEADAIDKMYETVQDIKAMCAAVIN
jgi:hypothetical protein